RPRAERPHREGKASAGREPGSGDDRTRTGGLSPDKRGLLPSELRPRGDSQGNMVFPAQYPPRGPKPPPSGLRARRLGPLSTTGAKEEGEGVEPPRPVDPPVFETGYRADGSPSTNGPGRNRPCNPPLKRRQLCRLSYGAVM